MVKKNQCKGQTKKNTRCRNLTTNISGLCYLHGGVRIVYDYKYPTHRGGGYITHSEASFSLHPQRAKIKFKGKYPSEKEVMSQQQEWCSDVGDLTPLNQRKGGMCASCGNNSTRLIYSDARGAMDGFEMEWEYYCPKCKKFTQVFREGEPY